MQPMKEMTRSAAVAWLASPTPIGTIAGMPTLTPTVEATPTPTVTITFTSTPTPTPTVEVTTVWTFTGRVTRYGVDEGLPDTQVSLTVRLSGGHEEVIPVTMNDSGDFVGEFESTGMVEVAIARITPPTASWQIRLANSSPWTQDSTDPTLFSTAVTTTEVPSWI
ncbi:MAG: hypothetical protein IPJ94_22980 [Chloroflexi bacterium]|nr:hypothetical protein [Chloroflexota bacterium]